MANSAGDARGSEQDIRKSLIEKSAVDVMVAVGSNFFYTVTLPCTLWFLDRGKAKTRAKIKSSSLMRGTSSIRLTAPIAISCLTRSSSLPISCGYTGGGA